MDDRHYITSAGATSLPGSAVGYQSSLQPALQMAPIRWQVESDLTKWSTGEATLQLALLQQCTEQGTFVCSLALAFGALQCKTCCPRYDRNPDFCRCTILYLGFRM